MPVEQSPRHYGGMPRPPAPQAWRCPACGAENVSRPDLGCPRCGSGKPGQQATESAPPVLDMWWEDYPPEARTLAEAEYVDLESQQAFLRGYMAGLAAAAKLQSSPPPRATETFDPALAEIRTVIAALTLFRDQVLAGSPEEIDTGEWLTAAQVTTLIEKLERKGQTHG